MSGYYGGFNSSEKRRNTRIVVYILVGVVLLGMGLGIYYVLNNSGLDNPYEKNDTHFDMRKNDGTASTPTPTPKDEKERREHMAGNTYGIDLDAPTEEMLAFTEGTELKGYARVEKCVDNEEVAVATFTLYSDGKEDNFINHMDRTFDGVCIDPGLEPPHDGNNRPKTYAYDGNKVGPGTGKNWWYGLTDYGYTATLEKRDENGVTVYDWSVVVNFGYGAYTKDCQRMKFHIRYREGDAAG